MTLGQVWWHWYVLNDVGTFKMSLVLNLFISCTVLISIKFTAVIILYSHWRVSHLVSIMHCGLITQTLCPGGQFSIAEYFSVLLPPCCQHALISLVCKWHTSRLVYNVRWCPWQEGHLPMSEHGTGRNEAVLWIFTCRAKRAAGLKRHIFCIRWRCLPLRWLHPREAVWTRGNKTVLGWVVIQILSQKFLISPARPRPFHGAAFSCVQIRSYTRTHTC